MLEKKETLKLIKEIVKKERLVPRTKINETIFGKSWRMAILPCFGRQRERLVLKVLVTCEEKDRLGFEKEINFLTSEWVRKLLDRFLPKVASFSLADPPWYLEEEIQGENLSKRKINFFYNPKFLVKAKISEFIEFFERLNGFELQKFKNTMGGKTFDFNKHKIVYQREIELLEKGQIRWLSKGQQTKLLGLFLNPPKFYFSSQNESVVCSDLSPFNIFLTPRGLVILDWDRVGISRKTRDFCDCWLRAACLPSWQRALFEARVRDKDEKFVTSFFLNLAFSGFGNLRFFNACLSLGKISKATYKKNSLMVKKKIKMVLGELS